MQTPCLIYDDPRPIQSIWFEDRGAGGIYVGQTEFGPVTRIVAYREHGDGDFTPWLAVYVGDHLARRIPARMVAIVYADPTPAEAS